MAKKKTSTEEIIETVAETISTDNATITGNLSLADLDIRSTAGRVARVVRRVEKSVNGREIIVEEYK